jgi:cytochrome c oxidase subunit 2
MEPVPTLPAAVLEAPLQISRTPGEVFNQIFQVFLILGTLVGVVVVLYTLQYVYRYRASREGAEEDDGDHPTLGELPSGGGKGRKLLLSFGLSTIIVVSLIFWTYGSLLYVESGPPEDAEDALEVEVTGYQFAWQFTYPNGANSSTLRVPEDRAIQLRVTSRDVFHNFGVPALHIKADAIPGQYTDTWFVARETGSYEAQCYEICGAGHSFMTAQVEVMEPDAFEEWYAGTSGGGSGNGTAGNGTGTTNGTGNGTAA